RHGAGRDDAGRGGDGEATGRLLQSPNHFHLHSLFRFRRKQHALPGDSSRVRSEVHARACAHATPTGRGTRETRTELDAWNSECGLTSPPGLLSAARSGRSAVPVPPWWILDEAPPHDTRTQRP